MKITYLYQYFGTPKGSWSTRVYELAKRWVEAGHEVTVITAPYPKSDIISTRFVEHQRIDGINLIVINSGDNNMLPIWRRAYRAIVFALVSTYYHIKTKSDMTIASSGPISIGVPALVGRWLANKQMVFEVRDLWPTGAIEMNLLRGWFIKKVSLFFEKLCYKNALCVVPCSKGMEDDIKRRFIDTPTLVIPNACDNELFEKSYDAIFPSWLDLNKKIFIYAGSLGFMDSCIEIVFAVNESKHKEKIQVVIIGKGSEESLLKSEIEKLGLHDTIKVLPLLPKTSIVEWYKKVTASFVLFKDYPILSTSSPNKMFDSFAAGVPIIQNTKGWIKNLVDDEKCGINVLPNNSASMALAIDYLVENEDRVLEMKSNAKRLAKEVFNRDNLAKVYLQKLEELTHQ